ncbi:MAG TPA: PAS domain-containing protein [Geobacteraceae bacterium]|nr:PAS domain-containing protein [Geobacteraceae bacterium]
MSKKQLSHEEALTELERNRQQILLLKSILESPHGIIFFSLDTEYRYTSFAKAHAQTMKNIWGVSIDVGTCMLDVILDDADRQKAKENFDAALSGENVLRQEEYGDANLRRTFWENRYSPMYDDIGNIIGLTVFVTDITEQRQAAEELKKVQDELRINLENQIKQLKGILPICSYCKKIRTDKESWQQLETYISEHSDALFTHGICPTCYDEQMQLLRKKR